MPAEAGNALRTFRTRSALLVRLTSASGAAGWGETWAFPQPASAFIRSYLAPHVLGARADRPVRLQADLLDRVVIDRRGQAHMAISGVDIACWDLWGQISGRPIHALMGGALRTSVRAYASGPLLPAGPDRYAGFAEALQGYVAQGFTAFKLRVGIEPRQDEAAIRQARQIIGPDALLMVDLNEAGTLAETEALAARTADCRLSWIEEPLPHDNLPGYTRLAARLPVPVAGGESFCGVQAFRESLVAGALGVIQPDIALCGGLTEAMRIAALADAFAVPVAPHVWGTGVNMLAGLQFCAMLSPRRGTVPFPLFEYDASFNPLRDAIFTGRPDAGGMIAIPQGPGLGIDITEASIAPFVTGRWTMQ